MEETILVPSPNWFEVSILDVASDGWVVYGGPNKCLIVLEPLALENYGAIAGDQRFKAHVSYKAHKEKISCVDISPEWPEKRNIITGSHDGTVKEWSITKENGKCLFKTLQTHGSHTTHKEEVIAIGHSTAAYVISVGTFGCVAKWELATNLVKSYSQFMHNFKVTCMSCSPHLPLHIAVGTKQGVIFVLDLNGNGKIMCKVRGQDNEITHLNWCPQYEVIIKKSFEDSGKKRFLADRLEKIRNEPEPEDLETSGIEKTLPDDSFDSTVVEEDDMFDIYKDHEADEFGHKKYVPEDILVKVKAKPDEDDFLGECERLKADILKKKEEDEQSLTSLVDAMEKADVNKSDANSFTENDKSDDENIAKDIEEVSLEETQKVLGEKIKLLKSLAGSSKDVTKVALIDGSLHIHKHLLASIGKCGSVRIWSKTGKIVASCNINISAKSKLNSKQPQHCTVCWYKPDSLIFSDGKNQLLNCNPLHIDSKNKLTYKVVHTEHRRGLYCIKTDAPRVQTKTDASPTAWSVWSVAQDRYLVKYSIDNKKTLAKIASCAGHVYDIKSCPYDAGSFAVAVGDGAVRVWDTHTTDNGTKFDPGLVGCYWQHVLGKVLTCAWHPYKENLLAFSTAESRVGLIETGKTDRPARVLPPSAHAGVYSLCWCDNFTLAACGGGHVALYDARAPTKEPRLLAVVFEGQPWSVSAVSWSAGRGLCVGSTTGGLALITLQGEVIAGKFVYSKLVETIDWHPQHTSSSEKESQYKDLVAACAVDREFSVVILKLVDKEGGGKQFSDFITLLGHTEIVYKIAWSPHNEEQILSVSYDGTIRVWDISLGTSVYIVPVQTSVLAACWVSEPALARFVLSAAADYTLRVWDTTLYPAEDYTSVKVEMKKKRRSHRKKNKKNEGADAKESDEDEQDDPSEDVEENVAGNADVKIKLYKKFLLPISTKQINRLNMSEVAAVLLDYLARHNDIENIQGLFDAEHANPHVSFIKMFGSINSVNQLLDMEAAFHLKKKNYESYMLLLIYRGHIDAMLQFASERDLLDPFLLNCTLWVSVKFWKDATKLYIAQMDRLAAKGEDDKLMHVHQYGGVPFRKMVTQLSTHDVMGALKTLQDAHMYKEAYILTRLRYMESVSAEVLRAWAADSGYNGNLVVSALIHIALGDIPKAATVLRRSTTPECLSLAAELAKVAGLPSLAHFIEAKAKHSERTKQDELDDLLDELPTKMELLMKTTQDIKEKVESTDSDNVQNFECAKSVKEVNGSDNIMYNVIVNANDVPEK